VYKAIQFLLKILRYVGLGYFITLYVFIDIFLTTLYMFIKFIVLIYIYCSYYVYRFAQYSLKGIVLMCYFAYRIVNYSYLGVLSIVLDIGNALGITDSIVETTDEHNKLIREENKKRLEIMRSKELRELYEQQEARRLEQEQMFQNKEPVVEEEKGFAATLNKLFMYIASIPKRISAKLYSEPYVENDLERQVLLLDLEGPDAEKSEKKVMYRYVAKNADGEIVKGYFPAHSKVEVHSFLLNEGHEVYSIVTNKWIQTMYGDASSENRQKIKTKDLIFFTTQLSTYIKAGIPLVDSLRILSRQFKNKGYSRIFRAMIYDLSMGDSFSVAMDKQGAAFPRLLINMVKASEMTGELPEALDDMAEYFTETDKTRKQMITALTYPAIILFISIIALVFIMVYVVPKFVEIFSSIDGADIPGITKFIVNLSGFLQSKWWVLLIAITVFIVVFIYLYKNVKSFKNAMQWLMMHMPVFGNVIIYNEVTMFTKTFASLLSHNVFITDSMEILNKLTNNEIYKGLINDTINNLAKGEKISLAFKNHWAFPIPAYEMITTGEMTGQLPEMMSKVSAYYQELHRNAVTRIKTFIEPIMILALTAVVGVIVLSIVIPMFNMYTVMDY